MLQHGLKWIMQAYNKHHDCYKQTRSSLFAGIFMSTLLQPVMHSRLHLHRRRRRGRSRKDTKTVSFTALVGGVAQWLGRRYWRTFPDLRLIHG